MSLKNGLLTFLVGAGFCVFGVFGSANICLIIAGFGSTSYGMFWQGFQQVVNQLPIGGFFKVIIWIPLHLVALGIWLVMLIVGLLGGLICPFVAGVLGLIFGFILMIIGFFKMLF